MRTLNTPILGTGVVGRLYFEGIRRFGYVRQYVIGEPPVEIVRPIAGGFGAGPVESEHLRPENPALDPVYICKPRGLHIPITKGLTLSNPQMPPV